MEKYKHSTDILQTVRPVLSMEASKTMQKNPLQKLVFAKFFFKVKQT